MIYTYQLNQIIESNIEGENYFIQTKITCKNV